VHAAIIEASANEDLTPPLMLQIFDTSDVLSDTELSGPGRPVW
jgi:hypothetical protein